MLAFTGPSYEEGGDVFVLGTGGRVQQLSTDGGTYSPSLSPDATEVVVSSIGEHGEVSDSFGPSALSLYVHPVEGGTRRALHTSGYATAPAWSPDGGLIAFEREPDAESEGPSEVWAISSKGGAERRLVAPEAGVGDRDPAWSPDGRQLAFVRGARNGGPSSLMVAAVDGGTAGPAAVLLASKQRLGQPAWSPDGERIAVTAETPEGGGDQMQVIDAEDGSVLTSIEAAWSPSWTADGRLLVYGRPPGISDASGTTRVAELVPDGDGFETGLPVPGIDPIGDVYEGYRVDAAPCDLGGTALTADVEPVGTISVTVPSTGEEVTVIDRAAAAGAIDQIVTETTGVIRTKLVELSQLGSTSGQPVDPNEAPVELPLLDTEGAPLVWVVCDDATCGVVDARDANFLMGGGSLGDRFDELEDLAPQ